MPVDTLSNDLWNWHVNMDGDVTAADKAVRLQHYAYVSPGPVTLDANKQPALMTRDPDGHATLFTQR
jgi:hypothetical protein